MVRDKSTACRSRVAAPRWSPVSDRRSPIAAEADISPGKLALVAVVFRQAAERYKAGSLSGSLPDQLADGAGVAFAFGIAAC
jgi:hypothetical protein